LDAAHIPALFLSPLDPVHLSQRCVSRLIRGLTGGNLLRN
jgi:hypothetical protein